MSNYVYSYPTTNTESSNEDKSGSTYYILRIVSCSLLLGILSAVYSVRTLTEKSKFNYIYYMSKILTIKNIVLTNHHSQVLDSFNPAGKPIGLPDDIKIY